MSNARTGLIRKDSRAQVPIAPIADDRDHYGVLEFARNAQCHVHGAAGRDAGEDAFLAGEPARHLLGFPLAHRLDAIDTGAVVDLRQVGLRPLADARDLGAFLRLAAYDLDLRVLLLEETRAAHDRAGGAHAGDEMGDLPLGVAPDFRPGGLVMRERVVRVRELVEHDALAFAHHLLRKVSRAFHPAFLRRDDDLRAVGAHGLPAL